MKVGSLFAGIGGFDLGFQRAGFETAWMVEKDSMCQRTLRKRFPGVAVHGDVADVGAHNLDPVDVICAGFPCQDLSKAGKREGLDGSRSKLFYEAIRVVRAIMPRVVVFENVEGLLTSNRGLDFAAVLREMAEGWPCEEVGWRVLDSQCFGVPQRRRRVFIVAGASIGCAEQILALSEVGHGDTRTVLQGREEASADASRCFAGCRESKVAATVDTASHDCGRSNLIVWPFRKSRRAASTEDYETWVQDGISNTLNSFENTDVRTTCAVVMDNDVRRLTPLESERLQGFPDGWTDVGEKKPSSDTCRYKQCGNAVTVNVAEWIARRAMMFLANGGINGPAVEQGEPA